MFGSVNLGARIISTAKSEPSIEIAHLIIESFPNFISPGAEKNIELEFILDRPGSYLLEIGPVAEGIGWFSSFSRDNAKFVNVVIR